MPATEIVTSLAERKAELLRRSQEHRQTLAGKIEKLRPVADWMDFGINTAKRVRQGWEFAGPLLATWKGSSTPPPSETAPPPASPLHRISSAISLLRSIVELWRK